LPREFIASHKRRRMIEAMAELCAEGGYEATKIADVVARAGVARKTLYDNFDGKEDLFLAAFATTAEEMRAAVDGGCATGGDPFARIEAGLAALLAFVSANRAAARLCMVEALSATPTSAERYEEMIHAFVDLLRSVAPGAPRQPPTLPETLVGGVAWILQERLRNDPAAAVEDLLPELSQFVLSPYRGVGKPTG
jgi:AcrR family transcriptional regulator